MKTRLTITIDKETLRVFKTICVEEGYKMSTKVEILVKQFIKGQG